MAENEQVEADKAEMLRSFIQVDKQRRAECDNILMFFPNGMYFVDGVCVRVDTGYVSVLDNVTVVG